MFRWRKKKDDKKTFMVSSPENPCVCCWMERLRLWRLLLCNLRLLATSLQDILSSSIDNTFSASSKSLSKCSRAPKKWLRRTMIAHKCQRHWNTCRRTKPASGQTQIFFKSLRSVGSATTSWLNRVGSGHWFIAPMCLHPDRNQLRRRSTLHFWTRAKNYCDARKLRASDDVFVIFEAVLFFKRFWWHFRRFKLESWLRLISTPKSSPNWLHETPKPTASPHQRHDKSLKLRKQAKSARTNFSVHKVTRWEVADDNDESFHLKTRIFLRQHWRRFLSTHLSETRDWWWLGRVRTRENPIHFRSPRLGIFFCDDRLVLNDF